AAWSDAMERIEATFFENRPRPAGEILPPAEARRRLRAGAYDLVVVPPVPGDAPRANGVDAPATTTVVRWMELDEPAQHRDLGSSVVLSADGFDHPCVGLTTNAIAPDGKDPSAPLCLNAGAPSAAPVPIAWLTARCSDRLDERTDRSRAAMLARLAA